MDQPNPFARALTHAPDYVPSYLSAITPESFSLIDDSWRTIARTYAGAEVEYTLKIESDPQKDTVKEVRIDGTPVRDLPMLAARPETVLEWFDAIVYLDACGREMDRQDPRWRGDDLETEFERMEHGVVMRAEEPVRLEAFRGPGAPQKVQEHLDPILAASPLEVEVRPVLAWPAAASSGGYGEIPLVVDPGEPDLYCALPFAADAKPRTWYTELERMQYDCYAYAHFADASMNFSGGAVASGGSTVFRLSELPSYVRLGEPGQAATAPWWAVCFSQLDLVLPGSPEEGLLYVVVDDNGASVTIQNMPRGTWAKRHQLQERFQRRWGGLADDSIPHTDDEIARAITSALTAIGGSNAQ